MPYPAVQPASPALSRRPSRAAAPPLGRRPEFVPPTRMLAHAAASAASAMPEPSVRPAPRGHLGRFLAQAQAAARPPGPKLPRGT